MYLKKYKLEKLFNEKLESFLIVELLPIKENQLVNLVQNINKLGLEVKSIKTSTAGGILKNLLGKGLAENLYKGNLVLVYPRQATKAEDHDNLIQLAKNLSSPLVKKGIAEDAFGGRGLLLGVYHAGSFYHSKTILNFYDNKVSHVSKIIGSLENNTQNTISILQNSTISILRILIKKFNVN
jgi:hypothetical protein